MSLFNNYSLLHFRVQHLSACCWLTYSLSSRAALPPSVHLFLLPTQSCRSVTLKLLGVWRIGRGCTVLYSSQSWPRVIQKRRSPGRRLGQAPSDCYAAQPNLRLQNTRDHNRWLRSPHMHVLYAQLVYCSWTRCLWQIYTFIDWTLFYQAKKRISILWILNRKPRSILILGMMRVRISNGSRSNCFIAHCYLLL